MRPRRSVLYVTGSEPRHIEKARGLAADSVILDLEDAVAPEAKAAARALVKAAVPGFGREVIVRVNAPGSEWLAGDLAAIVPARPDAVLLPKVSAPAEIAAARAALDGIPLWVMIETPRALLDCDAIAGAGVAAVVLGANDILKAAGGRHRPGRENLITAMGLMLLAARAHGVVALDGVHNDIRDEAGFAAACAQARDFGFDGKTVIHPSQVAPANAAFTPTPAEIEEARAIAAAFAAFPGKAVVAFRGRMIERLDADIAARTLAMAQEAGVL